MQLCGQMVSDIFPTSCFSFSTILDCFILLCFITLFKYAYLLIVATFHQLQCNRDFKSQISVLCF